MNNDFEKFLKKLFNMKSGVASLNGKTVLSSQSRMLPVAPSPAKSDKDAEIDAYIRSMSTSKPISGLSVSEKDIINRKIDEIYTREIENIFKDI